MIFKIAGIKTASVTLYCAATVAASFAATVAFVTARRCHKVTALFCDLIFHDLDF